MKYDPSMQRIDKKAYKAKRFGGLITLLIEVILNVILFILAIKFQWPVWIVPIAIAWTVLSIPFEIYIFPLMHYETWRYQIHEEEIELKHGFIFRKHTTIPMVKIQHIDVSQGPILKRYGLATIKLSTAAGSIEIPSLAEDIAEEMRKKIAVLARLSDEEI
ncbi:hypothetical protein E0485_04720 [Paenibacillus albiflavus]|uniref:YdbS-like PH domain-containing protein n=1 Tax=Paenibacillus albiflavus TaxID=2545760 RepID=A0A4R4EJ08_9BACL|nr:PH domain-containing protein [Paenibacillus albiflavus]TCZ80156.1 hypothetical protein E0485_04720 [Paenibacillus albiflavus]